MYLLNNFGYLLLALLPLLWLKGRLHGEVQLIFLLITRSERWAILLFSLIFLPGVFLHETSHYLMAKLLRVRTGRFSIFPQEMPNGKIRMGYVEIASVGPVRQTLVGIAPLLAGGAFVAYAGLNRLGLDAVWTVGAQQGIAAGWDALRAVFAMPYAGWWLYLTLAVSSTMFPSESDRQKWLPVGLTLAGLLIFLLVIGLGGWLLENIGPGVGRGLHAASVVFGMAAIVHLLLWVPLALLRRLMARLMGVRVTPR